MYITPPHIRQSIVRTIQVFPDRIFLPSLSAMIRILVPRPRIRPMTPTLQVQNLNHRITREVHKLVILVYVPQIINV